MLPYRLRPPVYGGKLKQQKGIDILGDPLTGGGPVQCAIRLDLLELRAQFLAKIGPYPCQELATTWHAARGTIFDSFKEVFRESKVALLHTRTVPPRCDRGSYSQLIYATCLSLLRETCDTGEGCFQFEDAAYALFCLYALYETNPLPTAPLDERGMLELLPLGIHSVENPKHLHRRAFKTPIRIDRRHCLLLQRLRDEALVLQADCHIGRAKKQENRIHVALGGEPIAGESDCCICGIATDTLHVLDSGFASDTFDMTEYTGPCGLEGLAGHEEYPFRCVRPKKARKNQLEPSGVEQLMTDAELDKAGDPAVACSSNNLSILMKHYWSHLESIRSASSNANQLPNHALELLRQQNSSRTAWKDAAQKLSFIVGKSVTSETRYEEEVRSDPVPTKASLPLQPTNQKEEGARPPYKVVMPDDLAQSVRDGIEQALGIYMERAGSSLITSVVAVHAESIRDGQRPSRFWSLDKGGADDISSVGYGGASVGSSIATGPGQSALRNLLKRASAVDMMGWDRSTNAQPSSAKHSPLSLSVNNDFLTIESHISEAEDSDKGSVSDVSELSSDDQLSVAASAIGRSALRTLLATVNEGNASKEPPRRKARRKAKTTRTTKNTLPDIAGNKVSPSRNRKRKAQDDGSASIASSNKTFHEDDSFVSTRGSGQAALEILLSRATRAGGRLESEEDNSSH